MQVVKQQIEAIQESMQGRVGVHAKLKTTVADIDSKYKEILLLEQDTERRGTMPMNGGRNSVLLSSVQEIEGQPFSVQIDLVARRRCCIAFETAQ